MVLANHRDFKTAMVMCKNMTKMIRRFGRKESYSGLKSAILQTVLSRHTKVKPVADVFKVGLELL
jgi:hypothetical protein